MIACNPPSAAGHDYKGDAVILRFRDTRQDADAIFIRRSALLCRDLHRYVAVSRAAIGEHKSGRVLPIQVIPTVDEEVVLVILVVFLYRPLAIVIGQAILKERLLRVDAAHQPVVVVWPILLQ